LFVNCWKGGVKPFKSRKKGLRFNWNFKKVAVGQKGGRGVNKNGVVEHPKKGGGKL